MNVVLGVIDGNKCISFAIHKIVQNLKSFTRLSSIFKHFARSNMQGGYIRRYVIPYIHRMICTG